jgi:pSer/pThr/pTyr-binding forkhead associated (FHA) protein
LRILLAAALYAFLGWALWLLWSSLRRQAQKAGLPQFPALTLTRSGEEGGSYRFTRPEVSVGRQPGSDLNLEDGAISARHARLAFHHGQWWAEDLRSRNGTFLNDERLTTALVLATGDELRFGSLAFRVEIDPLPAADEP